MPTSTHRLRSGEIKYDDQFGHVCTCTERIVRDEDGQPVFAEYLPTVAADRSIEPTEGGSWFYVCEACGAGTWSGL